MKSLQEFINENIVDIFENLFTKEYIHHKNKKTKTFDYGPTVIKMLLDGKKLKLGMHGDEGEITIDDFEEEKLKSLQDIFGQRSWQEDLNDFNKSYKKYGTNKKNNNIWQSIFKGDISGQYRKINGGMAFEDELCKALQELIIHNGNFINVYNCKEVALNFYKEMNENHKQLLNILKQKSTEEISKYIFVSGKGRTDRNSNDEIINKNFEINSDKNEIEKNLKNSGKIIADITITDNINFKKSSTIDKGDENNIYISCKDGISQLSGIELSEPFYGVYGKSKEKSTLINCYKDNLSYEEFNKKNDNNVKAFNLLCNFLNIDPKIIYEYFKIDVDNRKSETINTINTDINKNIIFSHLIQLIIGGNYYYINSNGTVEYIDYKLKDKFEFITDNKAKLDSKQIAVYGKIKINNTIINNCAFKFRNSAGGNYPFRLFFYCPNKHFMSEYIKTK